MESSLIKKNVKEPKVPMSSTRKTLYWMITGVVLGALTIVLSLIFFGTGIWTGDGRWAGMGTLLLFPGLIATIITAILSFTIFEVLDETEEEELNALERRVQALQEEERLVNLRAARARTEEKK